MKRWICMLLCVCMLPLQGFTALAQGPAQQAAVQPGLERWGTRVVAEHTVIDHDVVIEGIVSLGQNAVLEVTGGASLTVLENGQISGDVLVSGGSASLINLGSITGDVEVTGAYAMLHNEGRIGGCVHMDGTMYSESECSMRFSQTQTGYIAQMKINTWGFCEVMGEIGVLEMGEDNHFDFWMKNRGQVERAYVRGYGEVWFIDYCHVGSIYNYQNQDQGIVGMQVRTGSTCDTAYLYSGHLCVHNGGFVDTVYLMGDAVLNLDQGFDGNGDMRVSRVENVYQLSADSDFYANGEIGTLVLEEGRQCGGDMAADTVIVRSGIFSINERILTDDQISVRHLMDEEHVKTLIVDGGRIDVSNRNTKIGKAVLLSRNNSLCGSVDQLFTADNWVSRGWHWSESGEGTRIPLTIGAVTSFDRTSTLENGGDMTVGRMAGGRLNLQGAQAETVMEPEKVNGARQIGASSAEKPLELKGGVYQKKDAQSAYFAMNVDALTALSLGLKTPGFMGAALVTLPDGGMRVISGLDEGESEDFFFEEKGTVAVRLIGGAGCYELSVDRQLPVKLTAQINKTALKEGGGTQQIALDPRALTLRLVNTATGETLDQPVYEDGALYFPPQAAQPGDTIAVTAEEGTCEPVEAKIRLDQSRAGRLTLQLKEKGGAYVTASDMTDLHAYLYDADGRFAQEVFASGGAYAIEHMDSGRYSLLLIRGGVSQWQFPRVDDPKAFGLESGRDYLRIDLNVQAGRMHRSEAVEVPAEPSVTAEGFALDYGTNMPAAVPGTLVLYTLSYEAPAQAENLTAQITLSGSAQLVEDSPSIGGESAAYTLENGVLSVPLDKAQGRLQFYLKGSGAGLCTSLAALHYTEDGQARVQYAGSGMTRFAQLSMDGPSLISGETAVLSGQGMPLCEVSIVENGVVVGTGASGMDGSWSVKAKLSTYGEHKIVCRMQTQEGAVLESAPMTILRAYQAPEMASFTIYYQEHGRNKKIQIPADKIGETGLRYAYEPGTPFTFAVRMENSDMLKSLEVIAQGSGGERALPAAYDRASGEWIATGVLDANYLPQNFRVRYTLMRDPMEAKPEELMPTLGVEELAAFVDLGGLLCVERSYPASAALHTVNGMFGMGWRSDLETSAVTFEEEGRHYAAVTDARTIRLFVKETDRYIEMLGDATATVQNGAVTIREQSGAQTAFDKEGRLASERFADGSSRTYTYDEDGQLTQVKANTGETLDFIWKDGHVAKALRGGDMVSYTYDGDHLMLVSGPKGNCTYGYEGDMVLPGRHSLTNITQSGERLRVRYDDHGRVIALTDRAGMTTYEYMDMLTVRVTDPYGEWAQLTYGENTGKPERAVYDGIEMEIVYDENLRAVQITENGYPTFYTYDAGGHVASVVSELENTVYEYDKHGLISAVTSGSGTTRYTRDAKGNLTAIAYPDGTKESYTYDQKGRMTAQTDRDGTRHQYAYDAQGRLIKETHGKETTAYEYREDADNEIVSVHASRGERWMDYDFDKQGRSTFVNYGNGYMLSVGYNEESLENVSFGKQVPQEIWDAYNGEVEAARAALDEAAKDPENPDIPALTQALADLEANPPQDEWHTIARYEYDAKDRMSAVYDENGAPVVRYSYDEQGRLVQLDYEGGVSTCYGYDGSDLLSIVTTDAQGALIHEERYERDSYGRIAQATVNGEATQYAYDALGRLIHERGVQGETAYGYDMAGNRTSIVRDTVAAEYIYNDLNQLLSGGGVTYAYDKAGRRVSEESAAGKTEYAYDAQSRLVSILTAQGETKYSYDLLGNLSAIEENGEATQLITLPEGMGYAALEIGADGSERRLIWGAGTLAAMQDEAGTAYLHQDARSSVTAITDAQGGVLARYSYDTLGNVTSREESIRNRFTYVGGGGIMETGGLYAMRARFGDVGAGTFLTPDPAGQRYDLNVYRYVYGDPVNLVDLTGEVGAVPPVSPSPGGWPGRNPGGGGSSGGGGNGGGGNGDGKKGGDDGGSIFGPGFGGEPGDVFEPSNRITIDPNVLKKFVLPTLITIVTIITLWYTAPIWVPAVITILSTIPKLAPILIV